MIQIKLKKYNKVIKLSIGGYISFPLNNLGWRKLSEIKCPFPINLYGKN